MADAYVRNRNSMTRQQLKEISERIEKMSFKGSRIRVVEYDDQKWIVFADICKVLGYKNPNHESKRLLPDEKCRIDIGLKNTLAVCVNRDGLLALRLFSSKDGAEEFFEWASSEIFS